MVWEADCIIGPFWSLRGVITLAMMMRTILAKPTMEMRETQKLEVMEDDESVRRRVGQRDECIYAVDDHAPRQHQVDVVQGVD